jgi:transcriptional antiterminator RfaH
MAPGGEDGPSARTPGKPGVIPVPVMVGPALPTPGRGSGWGKDLVNVEHWYALYTKPSKEHQVDALLQGRGIETYLPTVRRKKKRRDRHDRIVYFPCYLFARLDFEVLPRSSIAWMPGIRSIASFGEKPAVVADEIVELIRRRLEDIEEVGWCRLKQGDRVRIVSGPLRDLDAVFDQPLSQADRVRILVDVVGRMTAVNIDYSRLEPLRSETGWRKRR